MQRQKQQKLRMMYHPAKKEVKFTRFGTNGKEVTIRKDSQLYKYMNKKGTFILQDYGDTFLEDIAGAFDGETVVTMEVVTTKTDFTDFQQMVEYYNEDANKHSTRIEISLLRELPDMEETYEKVKEFGEESIRILNQHRQRFYDIRRATQSDNVKKTIDGFSQKIIDTEKKIDEKINYIDDNNVNLCFAGTYSSGKSALINALLGHKILPEAVESKTAKLFRIMSPQDGEPIKLHFEIVREASDLVWNGDSGVFEFDDGPTENKARKEIQEKINAVSSEPQDVQIYKILEALNAAEDVTSDIYIYFPIPMDTLNLRFTIYDTPGTDSNNADHGRILEDALSKQTHSILVFVAAPNKLEGTGNKTLLRYLKDSEKKENKTCIDIGRSLFVINCIDSVSEPEQRKPLCDKVIKLTSENANDDPFTISLKNKKLFFTSAMFGYAAKAGQNGIDTKIVERAGKFSWISQSTDEDDGRYYRLDHIATSEYATNELQNACDEMLETAQGANDDWNAMWVGSGMYALEREIKIYGEKYAGAVKAFSIIDSVDQALSMINNTAHSMERQNETEIENLEKSIAELKETIQNSIRELHEKYRKKADSVPKDTLKKLHLDPESFETAIKAPAKKIIDKELQPWFFGMCGAVEYKEEHVERIEKGVREILSSYRKEFLHSSKEELDNVCSRFIKDVQTAIHKNGKISEQAKQYICDIRPPKTEMPDISDEIGVLYTDCRYDGMIFKDNKYIDKKKFTEHMSTTLGAVCADIENTYKENYAQALALSLKKVIAEFTQNLDNYSVTMRAMLEDKRAMEELREKLLSTKEALEKCQDSLDSIIWSVKLHD